MTNKYLPLSVIQCTGADAQDFLHDQLTQSVKDLDTQQARLFAYCSPRGRVLANGLFWRAADQDNCFYLLVHKSVAAALMQRLQMYVLRAKVEFKHLEQARVFGASTTVGEHSVSPLVASGDTAASWALPLYYGAADSPCLSIQAPGTEAQPLRFWQIHWAPEATANDAASAQDGYFATNEWAAHEIQLGWPWVQAASSDVFIPQNLNLDIVPAVNFAKGCFPGQEVVARSHYRAVIRRRAVLMSLSLAELGDARPDVTEAEANDSGSADGGHAQATEAAAQHSDDDWVATDVVIISDDTDDRPPRIGGRIANAAQYDGKLWLLLETNLDNILDKTPLALACLPQAALTVGTLPYHEQLPWEKKRP